MKYEDYFLEELSSLRELGREFAEYHPRLAPFLSAEAQDPDVERLLEGFAFLGARLRQTIDDEFPELSHSLLRVLWPHVLRPVPSLTTVEFRPLPSLSQRQQIPSGTSMASRPVQGTRCRFRTSAPVEVYPIRYDGLEVVRQSRSTLLRLNLSPLGQSHWATMGLDRLRLHLHGDVKLSYSLYWMLLSQKLDIRLWLRSEQGERVAVPLSRALTLKAGGFDEREALLPHQEELFSGFRLLHEYFCYPDKFLYVDLCGLTALEDAMTAQPALADFTQLEIELALSADLPAYLTPKQDNIRLFCTPAVNLFAWEARPLEVDHRQHEYRLIPEGQPRDHYDIYSVDQVSAWGHRDRQQRSYFSYDAFAFYRQGTEEAKRLFWQKLKPSVISHYGYDVYLSFLDQGGGSAPTAGPSWPQRETVSAGLTCTNRALAVELALGEVDQAQADTPEYVEFRNISAVTPCLFPVQDTRPLWQVLTYLSQNYRTLADIAALRSLMAALDVRGHYDRQHSQASRLKRDALTKVDVEPVNRLLQGALWRGVKIRITVQEDHFLGEGDLFLFGSVLNELFACTVPMNSFHELELVGTLKGVFHRWQSRVGRQSLV